MSTENQNVEQAQGEAQPIIPGTTYKTLEDAAKGFVELKTLVDRQGNDLGMTRKQLEQATQLLEKSLAGKSEANQKAPESQTPDFDAELAKIDQQIEKLDVDDPGYSKNLAKLNKQARALEGQKIQTITEQKLMSQFQKTLSEKDVQKNHEQWLAANPDFETPEMQSAISQYMAKDRLGVMDPILAYREIQMQNLAATTQQLKAENDDLKNRLKLKSGELEVGKVVTKTGGQPTPTTKQPKATGAELDAGMLEAFRNAK